MSLPSWDATPEARPPWAVKAPPPAPAPTCWADTAAAQVRMVIGLPVPGEDAERFAAESDDRWLARQRFREAWGMTREDDSRREQRMQELAQDVTSRRTQWIPLADGDETRILKRMRAFRHSQDAAATAQVYGPGEPNPQQQEAMRRIAAANGGLWSPVVNGVAGAT
jgi:hypothetical protein